MTEGQGFSLDSFYEHDPGYFHGKQNKSKTFVSFFITPSANCIFPVMRCNATLPASSSGASFFAWERLARNEWLVVNRKGPWEGYRRHPLSPSRLPLRAHFHQKRDVWVRGSNPPVCWCTLPVMQTGTFYQSFTVYYMPTFSIVSSWCNVNLPVPGVQIVERGRKIQEELRGQLNALPTYRCTLLSERLEQTNC